MGRIRQFLRWLMGSTAGPIEVDKDHPMRRDHMRLSDVAYAEAMQAHGKPLNAWKLPETPNWLSKRMAMALDSAGGGGVADLYNWAVNGAFSEGLGFLGYPYLAELSQRPEYRLVTGIWAAEATRKWIKIRGDEKRVKLIEQKLEDHKIRDKFRELAELDGFFGRGQLYIDLGKPLGSAELKSPLIPKAKVKPGSVKNFKVVEPFWSYPGMYQSTNPLAADFYVPKFWYVMNGQVHASRLLTCVGREMPDMLKPAYSFGGLALSQMIKPYVDNWLRSRQSVSDLLHSFSTMVLATDMSAILGGGSATNLLRRLDVFNRTRDNRGVMAINKDQEELTNVSTPLGTVDKLLAQSLEQISSISGIPLVVLLGVTPSGLNASSDGEIQTFYDKIKAYQEKVFREPLARVLEIIQYDLDGTFDPEITFEFLDLWEMPEDQRALVRKSDAETDTWYVQEGIISNEEVRERITSDENSPYYGMTLRGVDEEEDLDISDEDDPEDLGNHKAPPALDEKPEAAGIACMTADGRVLLLKRSDSAASHPGTWGFPAGMIEPGEGPRKAAHREMMEETGREFNWPETSLVGKEGVFTLYRATVPEPFAVTLNEEHTAADWFAADELPEPLHPGVVDWLTCV